MYIWTKKSSSFSLWCTLDYIIFIKSVISWAGGSLRGRGWKYGSGFVDGIFPVLSPSAQQILDYLQKEVNPEKIWSSLDTLPASLSTWDDIFNVAVQLRMRKQWDSIISVRNSCNLSFFCNVALFFWLLQSFSDPPLCIISLEKEKKNYASVG